jgi:Flp pilus assembly protein TadD
MCLVLLATTLIVSCEGPADRDKKLLADDRQALAILQQINSDLKAVKQIAPENFEKLKALREKYPSSDEIKKSYKAALVYREDWENLEKLLTETNAESDRDDQILLAKARAKLGKFPESLDVLRNLENSSNDMEVRSISALAYFNLGRLDQASAELDAVWDSIIAQKRVSDINLRGMIYFRNRDYEKAASTLERSLTIDSANSATNNMLSRTYSAFGKADLAEKYRLATVNSQSMSTEAEANKMRFVNLAGQLKFAWEGKQYKEVVSLSQTMLPIADEKNKPAILKYLAEAHKALGNTAEADAARVELQKLQGQ